MARHNFLVQGSDGYLEDVGNPRWVDVHTSNHDCNRGPKVEPMRGRGRGTRDEFNNDGFATIEEARKEVNNLRKNYASERSYRIIQIVS